jgi:hypothetical protein
MGSTLECSPSSDGSPAARYVGRSSSPVRCVGDGRGPRVSAGLFSPGLAGPRRLFGLRASRATGVFRSGPVVVRIPNFVLFYSFSQFCA